MKSFSFGSSRPSLTSRLVTARIRNTHRMLSCRRRDEGAAGTSRLTASNRRHAQEGDTEQRFSHTEAMQDAVTFGAIGVMSSMVASMGLVDPFGVDIPPGADALTTAGGLFADEFGNSQGSGIGLSGIGNGNGFDGNTTSLGSISAFGNCEGPTCGVNGTGRGIGRGGRLDGHKTRLEPPRVATTKTSGGLVSSVTQRVVRQNFGRFRGCYEAGLKRNPSLAGRVTTRFVIGRSGAVMNVARGPSDLPDPKVVNCVVQAYRHLSFPAPENGIVTVSYPISFSGG